MLVIKRGLKVLAQDLIAGGTRNPGEEIGLLEQRPLDVENGDTVPGPRAIGVLQRFRTVCLENLGRGFVRA